MPRTTVPSSPTSTHSNESRRPGRAKRRVREWMHIIHLIIVFLLAIIVFAVLTSWSPALIILYLVPIIIHIAIVEICFLCSKQPPKKLVEGWESLHGLRGRAFVYQFAAAFSWGQGGWYTATGYAGIVWISGAALFVLAILADDYGFSDWVDVSRPKRREPPPEVPEYREDRGENRAVMPGVEVNRPSEERVDEPSEFGTEGSLV